MTTDRQAIIFPDVAEIRKTRKKYHWQRSQSGIRTYRELGELEENTLKGGALPQKVKELIALGISISNSCFG